MQGIETILWRGIVFPGHESCALVYQDEDRHLLGTAVFAHEQQACRLDYHIVCDASWRTLLTRVEGWVGDKRIDLAIKRSADGRWWLNDIEQPQVKDCIDIDLNFSPSTNLLPIRRLNINVGEAADVKTAWLRFPSFALELLPQKYHRLTENQYRYESAGGQFVAELNVSQAGFVLDYGDLWQAEAVSNRE